MFSSLRETLQRSFTLRLNLWYAAVFVVSAGVLFALLYLLLGAALQRKDHEVIETRLRACAAIYANGGLPALQDFVQHARETEKSRSFFVRLTGPSRSALLLNVPDDWVQFDSAALEPGGDLSKLVWLRIPKDQESDVTVASMALPGGSVLQVGRTTSNRETILEPFRRNFLAVMTPTLLLGVLGGAVFAYRATKPVREVVATARDIIDKGNFEARVPVTARQSDLEELALQFNRVLDKNQSLIQGMRDALDNVAHDLRTPLARVRASVEVAIQGNSDAATREALGECAEECDRVLTMLTALMDITEAESGVMRLKHERTSIPGLLESVIDLYQLIAEEKGITIKTDFTAPCEAMVDAVRMRQVFANLLDNALKYTAQGGAVELSCAARESRVVVQIRDTGAGISESEQPRIWGRLYRGDRSRSQRGLGLGLSLVKAIIEAHHGEVSVKSAPGEGALFTVILPC
ncbi:MAG: HAMP domain-containing sensor histidine kinase [Steroidobacteraceae bacterium]